MFKTSSEVFKFLTIGAAFFCQTPNNAPHLPIQEWGIQEWGIGHNINRNIANCRMYGSSTLLCTTSAGTHKLLNQAIVQMVAKSASTVITYFLDNFGRFRVLWTINPFAAGMTCLNNICSAWLSIHSCCESFTMKQRDQQSVNSGSWLLKRSGQNPSGKHLLWCRNIIIYKPLM